jgi:hypothetical protein
VTRTTGVRGRARCRGAIPKEGVGGQGTDSRDRRYHRAFPLGHCIKMRGLKHGLLAAALILGVALTLIWAGVLVYGAVLLAANLF